MANEIYDVSYLTFVVQNPIREVIEESIRDRGIPRALSLVCFCLSPLSQTYHIRLSSITVVIDHKNI